MDRTQHLRDLEKQRAALRERMADLLRPTTDSAAVDGEMERLIENWDAGLSEVPTTDLEIVLSELRELSEQILDILDDSREKE